VLERLDQLWTRWRRRLLRSYARVFEVRIWKSVGFSPLLAAYQSAARDGLLEFEEGEVGQVSPHAAQHVW
jgi:hypothetical protein